MRNWRLAAWLGASLAALTVIATALNVKWGVSGSSSGGSLAFAVRGGAVAIGWRDEQLLRSSPLLAIGYQRLGWSVNTGDALWAHAYRWPGAVTQGPYRFVIVPTWTLLLVFAALASFAWRRGRVKEGCCHSCGYDLTRIASSRCPECGVEPDL